MRNRGASKVPDFAPASENPGNRFAKSRRERVAGYFADVIYSTVAGPTDPAEPDVPLRDTLRIGAGSHARSDRIAYDSRHGISPVCKGL